MKGRLFAAARYAALALICVVMLLPLAWTVATSLKPNGEILAYPPKWIAAAPTLTHYVAVLKSNMPVYFFNSILVSAGTLALTLILGLHVAYALSRYEFRLKKAFFISCSSR